MDWNLIISVAFGIALYKSAMWVSNYAYKKEKERQRKKKDRVFGQRL